MEIYNRPAAGSAADGHWHNCHIVVRSREGTVERCSGNLAGCVTGMVEQVTEKNIADYSEDIAGHQGDTAGCPGGTAEFAVGKAGRLEGIGRGPEDMRHWGEDIAGSIQVHTLVD